MLINPVHRVFANLVWWPSLFDIRTGAYLTFAPLRRSWLLRTGLLWLPGDEDLLPTRKAAGAAHRESHDVHRAKRRIWPADWPPVIVKIEVVESDCVQPVEPPPDSLLDLFI